MKRRHFLKYGTAAAAAAYMPKTAPAAGTPPAGPQFGLTTYMIGSKWSIPELIEFLPRFGIKGVELRTDMKFSHGIELTSSKEQRAETARRFADSPVSLVGIASGERYDAIESDKLEKSIERTKELLQLCADLGAGGLRVFPNDFHKGVPQTQTLDQIAAALKRLAPVADGLGVELRLEAHGSAGLLPNLTRICAAVDHKAVRIKLNSDFRDTAGDGLAANLESTAPYLGATIHMHILVDRKYREAKFYETQFAFLKRIAWQGHALLEIGDKPDNHGRFAELALQKSRWDELMTAT